MGNILDKVKGRFKDFLDQSKKVIQTPKELPPISPPLAPQAKNLLQVPATPLKATVTVKTEPAAQQKQAIASPATSSGTNYPFPKIEPLKAQEKPFQKKEKAGPEFHEEELKKFEDAINKMHIDVIHNETIPAIELHQNQKTDDTKENLYRPSNMGEGYFSEIEHYLKHKDIKEILDDVLAKDFLTNMKDYHDTKHEGKQFYFHTEDLKRKLEERMNSLKGLEEEWNNLKTDLKEKEQKIILVEKEIDQESISLKELFRKVKINQLLEKEAPKEEYFRLISGQTLKSLQDLRKALTYMSDEEFEHHVTPERNDFSNWTLTALKIPQISQKMLKATNKGEFQDILNNPLD